MKVTYISHSGFLVETKEANLLFDYFKGEIPSMEKEKPLYVFSSHSHHDHFNAEIFKLADKQKNVTYILSSDIKPKEGLNCISMAPYEECSIENGNIKMKVRTLKSTDLGVAFLVEVNDKVLYHAGDLHWWHWIGEPDEENAWQEATYKKELASLKGKHIDAAFLVLDPRQESAFDMGMDYFLQNVGADIVFPMHCWDDYSVISSYKNLKKREKFRGTIAEIEREGQVYEI